MSYINRNLLKGERIQFRTKKHVIIFIYPVFWTLFAMYASSYMEANPILEPLSSLPWMVALFFWGYIGLEYLTSEFVVTNKRVMMREGFFFRHSNETRLSAISQVSINQSLLGQMLNYGMVTVNAFGAFDSFSSIAHPFLFQKAVNEQIDNIAK